ncbi:hypothetical protein CJF31_00010143 [Rutstroemia sp. NJR-2017a BVV2]|nr:hypothetical protein CJF31_00009904 [Rutstroemia sp. NJR-2017a BVV2]PQE19703.1 hypothetical protein CJF31_00010143 [Rutstroemia sp. NJR-2017a BVV2]
MHSQSILLAALAATANAANLLRRDSWGGALSLGPTTSHILTAETVLIPGTAPSTQNGELFLWPGISNGTGDLIQTTLESWPSNDWCGATTGQWCVRASLFGSFGQLDGASAPVSGTDQVRINYTLEATGNWTQTVTNALTGAALSSFSRESGPMTGWGTGTECDSECTGTVAAQVYLNTTIVLAGADEGFGTTLSLSGGTTHSGVSTVDGGKTWKIERIEVPAMS